MTVGKLTAEVYAGAYRCLGKGGTLVLTGLADQLHRRRRSRSRADGHGVRAADPGRAVRHRATPYRDIPRLLRMHEEGRLELDRLITRRYSLDEVNQGYRDQASRRRSSAASWCTSTDPVAAKMAMLRPRHGRDGRRAGQHRRPCPIPRIAVLDVDGTLVDSNYQHALAWYRALRVAGGDLPGLAASTG